MFNINWNKRYKICINFHKDGEPITSYTDDITHSDIIEVAKRIIEYVSKLKVSIIFNYMIIQRTFNTGQIGIKIVLRFCAEDPHDFVEHMYMYTANTATVFCYQWTESGRSPNSSDRTVHLALPKAIENVPSEVYRDPLNWVVIVPSNQKAVAKPSEYYRLTDIYDGTSWSFDIDSFSQIFKESGEEIHRLVNRDLIDAELFIGLGGEMGYYAKANQQKFQRVALFTNSHSICSDCVNADQPCSFVNYDTFDLSHHHTTDDCVLLINISKNGLKRLASQVNNLQFKQIIYISCDSKSLEKDLKQLTNYDRSKHYNVANSRSVSVLTKN